MDQQREVGVAVPTERYGPSSLSLVAALTMPVVWERDGDADYASVEYPVGTIRYGLVVEKMDGTWDWSVWKPDNPGVSARHGVADTVQGAMREAEGAAEQ